MSSQTKTPTARGRRAAGAGLGQSQSHFTKLYSNGKVVAIVVGDELRRNLRGSVHMLRKPPAIAFDVDVLEQAAAAGAVRVRVVDQETGQVYKASMRQLLEAGTAFDRGHGRQVFLPLHAWQVRKRGGGLQLGLFEAVNA